MKTHVHLTPKVIRFIVSKMCEGLAIWDICKRWPDKVPLARTIYNKAAERPELRDQLNIGYTVLLYRRIDRLHELACSVTDQSNWKESEAQLKREIDGIKFLLAVLAPKISKRFEACHNTQLNSAIATHITSINYELRDIQ